MGQVLENLAVASIFQYTFAPDQVYAPALPCPPEEQIGTQIVRLGL